MTSTLFLLLFCALCLALREANVRAWSWAERARGGGGAARAGTVYELAILNEGPRLAVAAAAAKLLHGGSLAEGAGPGRLVAGDPPDAPVDPLERAVYEAVRASPQITVQKLKGELVHSLPVERMVSGLRESQLLIEAHRMAWVRNLWLAGPWVLVALGCARLATHWDYHGDPAMRLLLICVLWTAAVAIFHICEQLDFEGIVLPTARGRAALEAGPAGDQQARERDPGGLLALAVAQKGEAWLWRIDPPVAGALGVPRELMRVTNLGLTCGG